MLRLAAWTPAVPLLAWGLTILISGHRLSEELETLSDNNSGMVIADGLASAPGAARVFGSDIGYFTTIWLDQALRVLPGHRQLWLIAPIVIAVAAVAVLALVAWRLAGARTAVLTAGIAAMPPVAIVAIGYAQEGHQNTYLITAVLGACVAWVARWQTSALTPARLLWLGVVGGVAGMEWESDFLLFVTGILPLLVAPVVVAVVVRTLVAQRLAIVSAAVFAVATATMLATRAYVNGRGWRVPGARPIALADENRIGANLALFPRTMVRLIVDTPFGKTVSLREALAVLALGAGLVAVGLVLAGRWHAVWRERSRTDLPIAAYVSFWSVSAILVVSSYLVSTVPVDIHSVRYFVPILLGAAATVPLLVRDRASLRAATALLVTVYASLNLSNVVSAIRGEDFRDNHTYGLAPLVADLDARGLRLGYSGYWQANATTWTTDFRVHVYSVQQGSDCGQADPGVLCPYPNNVIDSWYAPRPHTRSFVLTADNDFVSRPPSALYGSPVEVLHADRYTAYVYDHDIAEQLTRP